LHYIISAFEQALKLGLKSVKITGGEPFLRDDIFDIFKWLKKNNIKIVLETNGTLIDEKAALAIKNAGIDFIAISLDGPTPKIHEEMRNVSGSFEKAVNGYKLVKKISPESKIQIIYCLWTHNKNYIRQMLHFSKDLGAESLKINPLIGIYKRASSLQKMDDLLSLKEIVKLYKETMKYIKNNDSFKDYRVVYDMPLAFKPIGVLQKDASGRCGIKNLLGITGDGSISICGVGRAVKDLVMGNIKDDKIKYIWENSKILKDIRNDIPGKLTGVCSKCILKPVCIGQCRAAAYWASGSILSSFPFCQMAYEQGIFPKTRIL
jgi:SynChlorMet cassette radical SAM/SPASM protein ScmF